MKVSCIIPAYNEESRIGKVLELATTHPLISEVVVINDCSTDKTAEVIARFPSVVSITHPVNKGKSVAVCNGIRASSGNFILLLDSDLVGLTADDITRLIQPVLAGDADISISLRRNCPRLWHRLGIDYISGERVFPRGILVPELSRLEQLSGFALESHLNWVIIRNKYRIKIVHWPGVDSPYKAHKHGLLRGVMGEIKMTWDIIRYMSPFGPPYQIWKMRKLRV